LHWRAAHLRDAMTRQLGMGYHVISGGNLQISERLTLRLDGAGALHPAPRESRGEVTRLRSASVFGRAFAVRVSLRHVPTHDVAESYAETAFLRLVEALV
jgi:hypothetical protein